MEQCTLRQLENHYTPNWGQNACWKKKGKKEKENYVFTQGKDNMTLWDLRYCLSYRDYGGTKKKDRKK